MKKIDRINWSGYPPYRQSVYDQEELTALELAGRTTHKVNELTDGVNNTMVELDKKEDSSRITNNRKLSPSGNFTGTWHGLSYEKTSQGVESSLSSLNKLQSEPTRLPATQSAKLLIQAATTPLYYLIQKRHNGVGYIQYFLERHNGSGVDDRDYGVDYELLRVIRVRYLTDVFLYQHEYSNISGTWSSWNENFPSGRGGFRIPYRRNNVAGSYIEFTTTIGEDGQTNIYFYMTGSSSEDVDISIDGEIIDNISLQNEQPQRLVYTLKGKPGERTIRVTNNTSSYVYVGGVNFKQLKDITNDVDGYDGWNYYNISGDSEYISNRGSSDYAFIDDRNSKYFGSYHGGEKLVSSEILIDGKSVLLELDDFLLGQSIVINQMTNLIDRYTMVTSMDFSTDGTLQQTSSMSGETTRLKTAYTALTTVDSSFDEIVYPAYHKITPADDGKDIKLGRTNTVTQRNSSNNRKVTHLYTVFNEEFNIEGGAFVRINPPHYNKHYYGKLVQSPQDISSLSFQNIRIFE